MRIWQKLATGVLISVLVVWTVVFYVAERSERALRARIEGESESFATALIDEVDRGTRGRIAEWTAYARSRQVQDVLRASNDEFAAMADRDRHIAETEQRWEETSARFIDNPLSKDLRSRLDVHERVSGYPVYPEVFLTNRYGVNVAQTGRTSDYLQSDEVWWTEAWRDGLFVGDVKLDESAGVRSTALCLRVDGTDARPLGVLKVVLDISDVQELLAARARDDVRICLLTSEAEVVYDSTAPRQTELANATLRFGELLERSERDRVQSSEVTDAGTGGTRLVSYARSAGLREHPGLGWTIVVEREAGTVFAPVRELRRDAMGIAMLATLVMALLGGWFTVAASRRIANLRDATLRIAGGEYSAKVATNGGDELTDLARSFNTMSDELVARSQALQSRNRWLSEEIDERKRIAADLERARDLAEESVKAKAEFLANVSHEIRTPMNGIIGMTNLLLDLELTPRQHEYARTISTCADALLALLNDILDFSKSEAGKLDFERINFDLSAVLDTVVEISAHRAAEKQLELTCYLHPDVPTHLRGDPARVRQILLNLANNAIKFTEKGEVDLETRLLSGDGDRARIRFTIRDTGIGISAEQQSRIFDAFSQADASTTRKYGGTGLGLAITRRLVDGMGGEIGVESNAGRGSLFWAELEFGVQPGELRTSLVEDSGLKGLHVLVADDNETNRRVITSLLEKWGCRHAQAPNGKSALALARGAARNNDPFAVALLDFQMPGMDGLELGARLRSDPGLRGLRLILLTSVAQYESDIEAEHTGFHGYLTKPLRESLLKECLARVAAGELEPELVTREKILEERPTRLRILVAEDNPVNQRVAKRMLEKLGHTVAVVGNGREALDAVGRESFAVLLMDCQMPGMDGYEATGHIRELEGEGRRTPIIAMTANAMEGDRQRCFDAGMDDYVAKPFRPEDLARVLRRWTTD